MTPEQNEAIHGLLHRLRQRWAPGEEMPPNDVWHAYDPLPFWDFLRGLSEAATLTTGRKFLDVGCGIGEKMALAYALGWEVSGIDRHGPYIEAAQELIPEAVAIDHIDLFDMESFDANFVYMYRPAVTDALEDKVEEYVLARVKPGTVMFFPVRRNEVWVA